MTEIRWVFLAAGVKGDDIYGGPQLQRTKKSVTPLAGDVEMNSSHDVFTHLIMTSLQKHQSSENTRQPSVDITQWWAAQIIHDPAAVWKGRAVNGRLPAVPPRPGSHPYSRATLLTPTPVLYALHTLEHSQELIPLFSRVRHPHAQVARSRHEPHVCTVCVCATVWWAWFNQKCLQTARKRLQRIVLSLSHSSSKREKVRQYLQPCFSSEMCFQSCTAKYDVTSCCFNFLWWRLRSAAAAQLFHSLHS